MEIVPQIETDNPTLHLCIGGPDSVGLKPEIFFLALSALICFISTFILFDFLYLSQGSVVSARFTQIHTQTYSQIQNSFHKVKEAARVMKAVKCSAVSQHLSLKVLPACLPACPVVMGLGCDGQDKTAFTRG